MTTRVVQKFGGTSVADVERLQAVAGKIALEVRSGRQVAVVVSAMAGVTNQLVDYTRQLSVVTHTSAHDVVLATGEQITTGLLSLALQQQGIRAEPFMGWQIPILTDDHHTNATIREVKATHLNQIMGEGVVPVVAGFQGISSAGKITTLGRGGSDATAVALAASLNADVCDIYTDVDGVYTADPRIVPKARRLEQVTYDEMLALSASGAKVLHWRSVQAAKEADVDLRVLSSFMEGSGTRIVPTRHVDEDTCISGVVLGRGDVKITLKGFVFSVAWESALNVFFSHHQIVASMLSHQMVDARTGHVSFVVPEGELARTLGLVVLAPLSFDDVVHDDHVARVSVVGHGITSHLGIAGAVFQVLSQNGIAIQAVTTSAIQISVLVVLNQAEAAVRLLHTAYGLDDSSK